MNPTRIDAVMGRRVWDSRGRPTVEAEVILAGGASGRAIAPAGASTGRGEAVDLRDGGDRLRGYDVLTAVSNVRGPIQNGLRGMDASNQAAVDQVLIELAGSSDKAGLGANATIAASMAVAHAAAAAHGLPLWRYLASEGIGPLPLPEIQIFGGGAHASKRIDVQDYMVVPVGATSFSEALSWTADVYYAAGDLLEDAGKLCGVADEGGFWPSFETNEEGLSLLVRAIERAGRVPGEEMAIALDVAASQFGSRGRYTLHLEDKTLDSAGLGAVLLDWIERYPIVSLEDPMGEDDREGMQAFTAKATARGVQVVGDDYLVTDVERIRQSAEARSCTCALIKPNQRGTLSETLAAAQVSKEQGMGSIMSARSGESEDVTIVHLAIGWGIQQIKVGSMARSERTAKWNEIVRVEEALGQTAAFAGASPLRHNWRAKVGTDAATP